MQDDTVYTRLTDFIEVEAEARGWQVVDIAMRKGNTVRIEVTLDKEGGITLDECGDLNRGLAAWIDSEGIFPGGYSIDVNSPGLDRQIRTEKEFKWARGRKVEVNTREPLEGKTSVIGKLLDENETEIEIEEENGNTLNISRDIITKVKLWCSVQ